jgi:hypothetical protein
MKKPRTVQSGLLSFLQSFFRRAFVALGAFVANKRLRRKPRKHEIVVLHTRLMARKAGLMLRDIGRLPVDETAKAPAA